MDWFRWHHGSVTDPKFQLVAKKAKASVAEVVAVWAYVLETASQNPKRGHVEGLDAEAIDLALGMDDGTTAAILAVLNDRGILSEGRIAAWEKRQPKREDDTANDRKRRQREREHELSLAAVTDAVSRNVTQGHAASRAVTPEEKREEEKDQKQEQKKEQEHAAASPPPASNDEEENLPSGKIEPVCRIVLDAYHANLPNCLPAHTLTPKRQRRILAANKLAKTLIAQKGLGVTAAEFWSGYFSECAADPWLRGDVANPNNPRWRQNIDVLLAEDRFSGIMDAALARDLGAVA